MAEARVCKLGAICGDLFAIVDRVASETQNHERKRELTYVAGRLAELREALI